MIRSLFKRSGVYLSGLTASRMLSTIVFILFARSLTPSAFGDFVLFTTLALTITYFSDFGLNQWYQKKASEHETNVLFNIVLNARLLTLLVSILLSFSFILITKSFPLDISLIFLVVLITEAFLSIIDGYYLERKQAFRLSLKNTIRMLIYLAGYVIFLHQFSFSVAVYLYLFSSIITVLVLFPWETLLSFSMIPLGKIYVTLKSSSSYALLIFTSYAYARGDSLVVRYLINSTALGLYGASYRFLEGLSLIPTALAHNLFPLSAKESNISYKQLVKITGTMIIFGISIGSALFFSANFLIRTLLGAQYIHTIPVLKIFSAVLLLFFINSPLSTVIQSSRMLKKFLPWGVGNTALNIGLNIIFVPLLGITGAAWVMFTTEVTGLLINLYFVKKLYS